MTQIQILGKEYRFACNMKALVAYERMTGKSALDLQQFGDNKVEASITLAYAMLLSNNDPDQCPEMEKFMEAIDSIEVMNEVLTKTAQEMQSFFRLEKGDKVEQQAQEETEPKNA